MSDRRRLELRATFVCVVLLALALAALSYGIGVVHGIAAAIDDPRGFDVDIDEPNPPPPDE